MSFYYPPSVYDYTLDEWMKHFRHFLGEPHAPITLDVFRYFINQYPYRETKWKSLRFVAGFSCLNENREAFAEYWVQGKSMSLISSSIIIALWRVYGGAPDELLLAPPPLATILTFADEQEAIRKATKGPITGADASPLVYILGAPKDS